MLLLYPAVLGMISTAYQDIDIEYHSQYYTIPKGMSITFPTLANQRRVDYIKGDPDAFKPVRWLAEPANLPFLLTFNIGAHVCLGKNLSMLHTSGLQCCWHSM